MAINKMERDHDKRNKVSFWENKISIVMVKETESDLMKGSSSTVREGYWSFMKSSHSILLGRSRDGIYWRKLFQEKRKNFIDY
jgi:hypothetical protein